MIADFEPFISFPDNSESFTLGFEAGMIYQQMVAEIPVINCKVPIHTKNLKVIDDMSLKMGYLPSFWKSSDEEWTNFSCIKLTGTDN